MLVTWQVIGLVAGSGALLFVVLILIVKMANTRHE
jgi:hypothetical protein